MALTHPPDTAVIGSIVIDVVLAEEGGIGISYGLDSVSKEAAIGYLMATTDRIRDEIRCMWDTCPGCGKLWEECGEEDEDFDEDDDDDEEEWYEIRKD
jgi:hypothetical protein